MLSGLIAKLTSGAALPTIRHEDFALAVIGGSCAIIDVREPHEYAAGHVPRAQNIPLSRFDPANLPQNMPCILICQAGGRSAKALVQAMQAGCKDIRHYAPGTGGWRVRGGELAR